LISGDKEGNISIWDSNKFELKNHLKGHSGSIYSLSISPDDLKIISAGDYTVRIWKLENA
jgi:WD40 repeat protein